jgi:ADP-ribose pyrophosphatase YjhB (NUDIX family)
MTQRKASYCPDCGSAVESRAFEGRERQYCPVCARFVFQNPVPGSHVVVLDGPDVLLIERGIDPDKGAWAVPGGILEVDESARDGAARELEEETGVAVDPGDLVLVGTGLDVDDPDDGSYLSVCFAVERNGTVGDVEPGDEASDARFRRPETVVAEGDRLRSVDRRRIERAFVRLRGVDADRFEW